MVEKVEMFRGKNQFLSNMYAATFTWDGRTYTNSEAAFQSAKSLDPAVRDEFSGMAARSPSARARWWPYGRTGSA